jgi:hypothetical protein
MLAVLRADTTAAEAATLRASVETEGVTLGETALEGRTIFRLDGCGPGLAERLSLDPRVKEVVGITPALAARTFYPRHFLRIVGAMLALAGALILLAAWLPPSIKGPADSFHPPPTAPIPWYVLWFQGLEAVLPGNLKIVGSLLVLLGSALFVFFPLLDAHDGGRPRRPWLSWVAGIVGIIALVALTLHGAGLK